MSRLSWAKKKKLKICREQMDQMSIWCLSYLSRVTREAKTISIRITYIFISTARAVANFVFVFRRSPQFQLDPIDKKSVIDCITEFLSEKHVQIKKNSVFFLLSVCT